MFPVTMKCFNKEEYRGQKNIKQELKTFSRRIFPVILLYVGSLEKITFAMKVNKSLNIFEIVEC